MWMSYLYSTRTREIEKNLQWLITSHTDQRSLPNIWIQKIDLKDSILAHIPCPMHINRKCKQQINVTNNIIGFVNRHRQHRNPFDFHYSNINMLYSAKGSLAELRSELTFDDDQKERQRDLHYIHIFITASRFKIQLLLVSFISMQCANYIPTGIEFDT